MARRGYGLKRWWRAARLPGESLKAFARRFARGDHAKTTTAFEWLRRKGCKVDV